VLHLHRWLNRYRLADAKLTITITLLTPYAMYLPAEHLHISGVLAVVACGLWVGGRADGVFDEDMFCEARAVWEMMEFLLNSLIFILIGLQLPVILAGLNEVHPPEHLLSSALVVSAVVVLSRMLWVFPGAYIPRYLDRFFFRCPDPYPPWQSVTVVGWTGMRGVVSLAAALALPDVGGQPFPHRDLIQFLTFWVIFATLVGQGLTLPLLIRALGVDRFAERETPADEPASC
jgi:monovalent cation/hydrogen antiporter